MFTQNSLHPTRIAIDGNEANVPNRVGSNVYAYEIISAMEWNTRQRSDVDFSILLSAPPSKDMPVARLGWQYKVIKPRPFWTQFGLPVHLFLNHHQYDVFFTPGHYAPRYSSVPYVSSVMDLAFLEYPEQFKKSDLIQLTDWTAYSVAAAQKVIAISEFTRQAVIKAYHKRADDVVVAPPAVFWDKGFILPRRQKSTLKKLGIVHPYFLYVGTLQPRKNLLRLIEAFERISRNLVSSVPRRKRGQRASLDLDLQLVIAGKIGWLADDILKRVKESPFSDRIILTGYVDEFTKQVLYENALANVLVGLYEGFGIPPLEALRYGTIPIVSETSSLPEVVGKAGILVDPLSIESIADGMTSVMLLTAKQRAQLQRNGRLQLRRFSWEGSAEIILTTLLSVAQNRH